MYFSFLCFYIFWDWRFPKSRWSFIKQLLRVVIDNCTKRIKSYQRLLGKERYKFYELNQTRQINFLSISKWKGTKALNILPSQYVQSVISLHISRHFLSKASLRCRSYKSFPKLSKKAHLLITLPKLIWCIRKKFLIIFLTI